jgi:hypothetical protein
LIKGFHQNASGREQITFTGLCFATAEINQVIAMFLQSHPSNFITSVGFHSFSGTFSGFFSCFIFLVL